jgi:four helix bundle protein
MKDNKQIKERTYEFSISIIKLVSELPKDTAGFVLGRQLVKSGTSIGANVEEATGAFSKDDFIFKMNIALKEARETNYWLRLLYDSGLLRTEEVKNALKESEDLRNIISAIVKTSKERREVCNKGS